METTNDLHAVLVNASVAAERAFQVAVSDKYVNHPELHRHTWATATIIQCDILRYLITLEESTREGLVCLLWMGDVASALYEAKKWFLGAGNQNLISIAKNTCYDVKRLQSEIKSLKMQFRLDDINRFKNYRNKVGHHYDERLIEHLRMFSESDSGDFHAFLVSYVKYSNGWASLFKKVLDFKARSIA